MEKNNYAHSTIFPSFINFFIKIILFLMAYQHSKSCFLVKYLNKSNNLKKKLVYYLFYIIFILHLKFHTKTSPITSFLKYTSHFSYSMLGIFFYPNIFFTYKIFIFCWMFLKKWWNQVPNFSNLPKVHNVVIKFGVHNLSNFWIANKCTLWQQFWGTLMCLWLNA